MATGKMTHLYTNKLLMRAPRPVFAQSKLKMLCAYAFLNAFRRNSIFRPKTSKACIMWRLFRDEKEQTCRGA